MATVQDLLIPQDIVTNQWSKLYVKSINTNSISTNSITANSLIITQSVTLPTLGPQLPLTINDSGIQQQLSVNYSGAWVAAGAGALYFNKIGNFVNLVFSQQAPATVATANTTLNLSSIMPLGYRPRFTMSVFCSVFQANLSPPYTTGILTINTDGTMIISSPNNAGGLFPFGQSCGLVSTISFSYPSA